MIALMKKPSDQQLLPLAAQPEYAAAIAEIDALRARAEKTEQRRQSALARQRGTVKSLSPLQRAQPLLEGGQLSAIGPRAVLEACDEEDRIIFAALNEARSRADEIADRLSFEICTKVQAEHQRHLIAAFKAMAEMHAAIHSALSLQRDVAAAGYTVLSYALPLPIPYSAGFRGDPKDPNGPVAIFRCELQKQGIAV